MTDRKFWLFISDLGFKSVKIILKFEYNRNKCRTWKLALKEQSPQHRMEKMQFGSNLWKKILEHLVYYKVWKVWYKPVNVIALKVNAGCRQDGEIGDLSLCSPTKLWSTIRQLSMNENGSGRGRSPLRKLSEHSGPKKPHKTIKQMKNRGKPHKKGRKSNSILPATSHPPGWHCWVSKGTSQLERVPLTGEGRREWAIASPAFWDMHKGPTLVSPHPETSQAAMYRDGRNKEEG